MWAGLDEDRLFELILLMDPDGSVDRAVHELEEADWERERAAMTAEQRQAIDKAAERGIARGMEIVQRLLSKAPERQERSDEVTGSGFTA